MRRLQIAIWLVGIVAWTSTIVRENRSKHHQYSAIEAAQHTNSDQTRVWPLFMSPNTTLRTALLIRNGR